jgi:predicted translin family RNA/ssDNA-binding protein
VDPVTPNADFGRLMQYGAVGIVAAGLLALVVGIFRQLVNHILKQNEKQQEIQEKTLESLHAIGQAIRDMDNTVRQFKVDVSRDVADMVRDEATSAGSRAYRTKPPR